MAGDSLDHQSDVVHIVSGQSFVIVGRVQAVIRHQAVQLASWLEHLLVNYRPGVLISNSRYLWGAFRQTEEGERVRGISLMRS